MINSRSVVLIALLSLTLFSTVYFSCFYNRNSTELFYPESKYEDSDKKDKNKSWTKEEAVNYRNAYARIRKNLKNLEFKRSKGSKFSRKSMNNDIAGGVLSGNWKSRGPFNVPGAYQFCEMDDGTDTVYTVTCGHYGGVQFIWKGTLWGDDWKLITPKHPSRFRDLIVVPNGNKRRVIAGHQNGSLMYSDDEGITWNYSTGLPNLLHSTIVNKQDNNKIYTTDGKKVYVSTDLGTSFVEFQTIGASASRSCLYSPRFDSQPNASDVYLVVDTKSFKLTGSSFTQVGTAPANGWIRLGGDSRKLWLIIGGTNWYYSEDGGATWTSKTMIGTYYGTTNNNFEGGEFPGVSPEDPNVLIGGYTIPVTTRDAGNTANLDAKKYWGKYQVLKTDEARRTNFHPDNQASQFFYDKNGDLISLRSSDGGVFISYNEWTKTSFPTYEDINGVYHNITLYDNLSQEIYPNCFAYGAKNINDMTAGTQDMGDQVSRLSTYQKDTLWWDFTGGGDGKPITTGDGIIGWSRGGSNGFTRFPLYNGDVFLGVNGKSSGVTGQSTANWTDNKNNKGLLICDWEDNKRMWITAEEYLRRIEFDETSQSFIGKQDNFTNSTNHIQGIAQSRVNPNVVFAMQSGQVFKSTDRGRNWTQIASSSDTGMSNGLTGVGWSSPIDQNIILFACANGSSSKAILSIDGGLTWIDVTGTNENEFITTAITGLSGNDSGTMVYAATRMGPYVFMVDEQKWYPMVLDENTPIFRAQSVHWIKYGNTELVRFSTWGSGVWDFMITPTQEDKLYIMNDGLIASEYNVYTELDSVVFNDLVSPRDSMFVMKNGEVIEERNLTTDMDSLIFYRP